MSDEFADILTEISSGPTNKQVQELGMILTRTLEIVINAVDMLEQNLNSINNSLNSRMNALEKRLEGMGSISTPVQTESQVTPTTSIPEPQGGTQNQITPPTVTSSEIAQAQPMGATPSPGVPAGGATQAQPSQPETPPKPISPVNIRRALNTELKQLFTKMRSQSE